MKRFLVLLVFSCSLLLSFAESDDFNLYYDATAGTEAKKIEAVANLQKLTFENGKMTVIKKDGTTSVVNVANIQRLFFATSEAVVGIEEIEAETRCEKEGVYDLMGRRLDVDLNKQQLPKGLYIIDGKKVLVK